MNILDKTQLAPFSFLVLPPDFEISDEPQIIFAPNGTGKSTLFNVLIRQNSDRCEAYTYDPSVEPTYKAIEGKKKKLIINPLTKNYSSEVEKRDAELKVLGPKESLAIAYHGQSVATLKKSVMNENIKRVINDNVYTLNSPLDDEDKQRLRYVLPYFDDIKRLISEKNRLLALTDDQKEAEVSAMEMLDRKLIYVSYDIEKHKKEIESEGCPLCGNNDSDVFARMVEIKKRVLDAKIDFFKDFEFLKNLPSGISPIDAINVTTEGIVGLSEEKVLHLLMTGGNPDRETMIQESIAKYNSAASKIATYLAERDEAYNKMSSAKETIVKLFPAFYPKSSVRFDDVNKQIEISTNRNMETYSEGEKHEMYSIIRELAILGSEKEIVIADDPLTELDVANEYRNVFRFIRLAQDNGKKVIVFTCNPNFVNIANEYRPGLFKMYYLASNVDTTNDTLNLKLLKMDFPSNGGQGAYVSLKQCVADGGTSSLSLDVVNLIKTCILPIQMKQEETI